MAILNSQSDYERAESLQNTIIAAVTNGNRDNTHYVLLRKSFMEDERVSHLLPSWVRTCRDLDQVWNYIKPRLGTYKERREFVWNEFEPLLSHFEGTQNLPAETNISNALKKFGTDSIREAWKRALERKVRDPEGAITISRTILESVCKHILDARGVPYDSNKIELSELYKLTAKELNLAPEQHGESIFKQILGGCSAIVNGLGTLRNKLGDAHGKGRNQVRPKPRHAELAVNLAGSMALFLVETYEARNSSS